MLDFERNVETFFSKYRFRPMDVQKIVRTLSPLLPENGFEPWEISKLNQVLITLRYLATNSHQTVIADVFGVSQKAVSDVITRVVDALNHPMIEDKFLRFWVSERWCLRRSREFTRQSKCGGLRRRMPHPHPPSDQLRNNYYCRKACCAVNVVAVVDARGRFTYINCGFAGRHHDSFIWRNSQASWEFEEGRARPGYRLLGDAGSANSSNVMTPYRQNAARADRRKRRFNKEHAKARNVVEKGFGALKRRARKAFSGSYTT
ncbi:hypothetical protein ANCCAN_00206 [Ancylostoma caninum]|uniref:Uncharacterized protein n=1 Tax=Ancylostoma caninum TaxID=29170 RepID=A0A368HAT2_ANCCA|nr:hypothetical protein ANCCAN_00206 [Ancylostoma caninum]